MGLTIDEILTGKASKEAPAENAEVKAEAKTEEKKEEAKSEIEVKEPEEKMVPLKALQDERMKRRQIKQKADELEQRLAKLEADKQPYSYSAQETEKPASLPTEKYKEDRLIQTINTVRATRPDADEMLNLFDEAVEQDESIYSRMMDQPDPGTFAYEFGRQSAIAKKYGATPEEAFKKAWAEAEKVTEKKLYEKLKSKKEIGDKLPKDLTLGGQSGSGTDVAEWTPKSSKEVWG